MSPQSKPWYKSRTVAANVLTGVIASIGVIGASDVVAEYPKLTAALMLAMSVGNVWLRLITKKPVTKV